MKLFTRSPADPLTAKTKALSKEIARLEAALRAFPGALLLVTHDEQLAARCTTERWELGGDRRTMGS